MLSSGDATLEITLRRSAIRIVGASDMGASRAAPLLHEPEVGFVRRIKRNRRMSNGVRLAKLRERERILGALQRFGAVAYYPRPAGDGGERFRLMLEPRAIDEPNRIIGIGSSASTAPATLSSVSPSMSPPSSVMEARLVSRVSSSPKTSIERGANPAWAAQQASARAE